MLEHFYKGVFSMNMITYVKANKNHVKSYCNAVDTVARERKYLSSTEGFPLEGTLDFVMTIESKNLAQYYAVDNEHVIGWCDIIPKPFEGRDHVGILGMGILKEYRNKGIGTKLLLITMNHAKKINGIEKVELEVFKSNINAIKLYEKNGFVIEGERKNSRKLDGIYDNEILMGKFL